jgi:hypothetical protein
MFSYNQNCVDQADDKEEVGYSLLNTIWEKIKVPETKHVIHTSSA